MINSPFRIWPETISTTWHRPILKSRVRPRCSARRCAYSTRTNDYANLGNTGSTSKVTLDEALVNQDPYKRIRFARPLHMIGKAQSYKQTMTVVKDIFPDAVNADPYLMPFWVIQLVCDQSIALRFFAPNSADYVETPQRFQSEIGLSVAAVPENHWASGVITPQNVRGLAQQHHILFNSSKPDVPFLPSESPSIYSRPEGTVSRFLSEIYNPETSSKFALAPPQFTEGEMERIISLQANTSATWEEVMKPRNIKVFAVPQYRLVYKVELSDRSVGIMDAMTPVQGINSFRINWLKGGVRPVDPFLHKRMGYFQRLMESNGTLHPHLIEPYAFTPMNTLDVLFGTVHQAMKRRGPMTPEMWEDERILPEIGPMKDGNAQTLFDYTQDMMMDSGRQEEPRFPIKRSARSATFTNLFTARTAPKPKAKRASPASSAPPGAAEDKPTLRYGASASDKRRAYIRERARLAQEAVRGTIRTPYGTSRSGYPDPLPDPHGHYERLGITPGPEYLDPDTATEVNKEVWACYIEHLKVHPDKGGKGDDFDRLKKAKEAVATLKARQTYYNNAKTQFR